VCCEGGNRAISKCNVQPSKRALNEINCAEVEGWAWSTCWKKRNTVSLCTDCFKLATSQIRHSTRAGMFTSRGQKADRPVTPNGYSSVLKIQDGKRVQLLGINLVLGTVFVVDLDCWYAINTALPFQIQIYFLSQRQVVCIVSGWTVPTYEWFLRMNPFGDCSRRCNIGR